MKYCVQTETCIFSRYTEKKFALSSQEFKIIKNGCLVCPKKFMEETRNKYPMRLNFKKFKLCIYDTVLKKDIIYFYFETNNPDSITLDKIYQNKKFPIFADGKTQKPKCNEFVPSVQKCSLLPSGSDYSTQIEINGQPFIVIIDTGSSTLGVPTDPYIKPKDIYGNPLPTYKPTQDKCVKTTDYLTYAQYGSGSWGGSIVISKLEVGSKKLDFMQFGAGYFDPNLKTPIKIGGIIDLPKPKTPIKIGGIIGLCYSYVTNGKINYNKNSYPPTEKMLTQEFWDNESKKPKIVYPTFMDYYGQKYSMYSQKFGICVQRNFVSNTKNEKEAEQEPTNYGLFMLGGGEQFTNLYVGELSTIPVIKTPPIPPFNFNKKDEYAWYTIQLNSFQINKKLINIPKEYFTIIDSGTSPLFFPDYFYEHIKNIFTSIKIPLNCDGTGNFWDKYTFDYILSLNYVDINNVCMKYWPIFEFPLTDKNGNQKIFKISPHNYWNIINGVYFFFMEFGSPFIVLSLPFLCENYCVFDYGQKQVKIAPRK
jgi:hypothetical protein